MGASSAWNDAEVDFGLAKDGRGGSEDDVAHKGEFATAAELRAIRTISELMNEEPWKERRTAYPLTAAMIGLRILVRSDQLSRKRFL